MLKIRNATDQQLAHFGLRMLIGINLTVHGIVRFPKLSGFANGMAKKFDGTLLPPEMALPFAYAIPFIEVALGACLLLGLQLRLTLLGSLGLMCLLTAGVCLQEQWDTAGSQLIYGLVFAGLLATRQHAAWTLDRTPGPAR